MASSVLEQIRQYHEDIEVTEKVASRLMGEKAKRKAKYAPVFDHAILKVLHKAQDASRRLLELYGDKDGLRKEEIGILGGQIRFGNAPPASKEETSSRVDDDRTVWLNYYDRLKAVKDYHRTHTANGALADALATKEMLRDITNLASEALEQCNPDQIFRPEEHLGRFINLEPLFLEFINLRSIRKHREILYKQSEVTRLKKKLIPRRSGFDATPGDMTTSQPLPAPDPSVQAAILASIENIEFQEMDYITYLRSFDSFEKIPRHLKYRQKEYKSYLEHLNETLQDFLKRLSPLSNHARMIDHLVADFNATWERKLMRTWETPTHELPGFSLPTNILFSSPEGLENHKKGKKFQKAAKQLQSLGVEEQQKRIKESEDEDQSVAKFEFLIQKLKDILSSLIDRTIEHLQKKQSRTLCEMQEDESDDDELERGAIVLFKDKEAKNDPSEDDDDTDDGKPVYNPLNLPLGWDGKPIPFWLYKLHGLGVEFKCEICGNYSYWGRRAFERHFHEWRHAFGMRCLKIPNTIHFKEITKIDEALMLYEKLKKEAELQAFKADQDVECEDSEGNVMSARAFADLRRQGLL